MAVAVGLARVPDAAALARLQSDFNAEFDSPCPPRPVLAGRLGTMLAGDYCYAVLAGPADHPCGHALVTLRPTIYSDGPVAVLDELYVAPPQRGQGIGAAMLRLAVDELLRRGGEEMHINVDEDDVDARRFYERRGFTNREPGNGERMLLYECQFPGPAGR